MFSLTFIIGLLVVHWFADFVMQSDEEAKGKSTSNKMLLRHTIKYSVIINVFGIIYCHFAGLDIFLATTFTLITFVAHTITDYFSSRINSYLYKKGDTHNLFVSIGFDQILHYAQLFGTYILLT